jgi:hypothetical protein
MTIRSHCLANCWYDMPPPPPPSTLCQTCLIQYYVYVCTSLCVCVFMCVSLCVCDWTTKVKYGLADGHGLVLAKQMHFYINEECFYRIVAPEITGWPTATTIPHYVHNCHVHALARCLPWCRVPSAHWSVGSNNLLYAVQPRWLQVCHCHGGPSLTDTGRTSR